MSHLSRALLRKTAAGGGGVSRVLGSAYKADALRHGTDPMHMFEAAAGDPMSAPGQVYHGAELIEMGHKASPYVQRGARQAANVAGKASPYVKAGAGRVANVATKTAPLMQRAGGAMVRGAQVVAPRLTQAAQTATPYLRTTINRMAPKVMNTASRLAPTMTAAGRSLAPALTGAGSALAQTAGKVAPWAWAASIGSDAAGMYFKDPVTGKLSTQNVGQTLRRNVEDETARADQAIAENQQRYGKVFGTMEGTAKNAIRGFTNPGRTTVAAAQLGQDAAGQAVQGARNLGAKDFARYMTTATTAAPTRAAQSAHNAARDKRRGYRIVNGQKVYL